ncbi:MAG TPA: phosphotransferase [Anaerolineae bacterium]|nr:phosphotransferase [Anaerolineae bacterium]
MSDPILTYAAHCYDFTVASLTPLAGGHFSRVYEFRRDGREYVLRVTPPDPDVDMQAMRAILAWMRHLADHGASVAGPVPSRHGRLIEAVGDDAKGPLLTVFPKAPGVRGETLAWGAWDDALITRLGQTLGKLHAVAQTYMPPDESLRRPTWDVPINCYHQPAPTNPAYAFVLEKRRALLDYLATLPRDAESYGLIHGDFHGGNCFVDPATRTITVFDFDDCVYGWYGMDIAMSVLDALVLYDGADSGAFAEHFLRCYLRGYLAEKSLAPFWAGQLPYFLKLLEVNLYLMVAPYATPENDDPWIARFMPERARRIAEDVPYVALDFRKILKISGG